MAKVINCECGLTLRGETDEEVLTAAKEHIRESHPDLGRLGERRAAPGLGPGRLMAGGRAKDELEVVSRALCTAKRRYMWLIWIALGASVTAPTAQAAFPGANGKIAFTSTRDGNLEIYVMNADGTDQVNRTNNPATEDDHGLVARRHEDRLRELPRRQRGDLRHGRRRHRPDPADQQRGDRLPARLVARRHADRLREHRATATARST